MGNLSLILGPSRLELTYFLSHRWPWYPFSQLNTIIVTVRLEGGGILLARLFPDDAVVLTPAPVHTVVRYRALAAVQGTPITLSHG